MSDMPEEELCPKCKSEDLDFDLLTVQDARVYYPVKCKSCGFVGKQWYYMEFDCFTDEYGEEVKDGK